MRQSQLFTKTQKSSKKFDSVNATLLTKGGFIDQTMAGVYSFLPLGFKVLNNIEDIIREEMDKISSEMLMPAMAPMEYWERTGRLEGVDILMKAVAANKASKAKNDANYVLNATHEDVITPIAQKFSISYRDFPFSVYQIQTKFRNEERPKSGLLRGREFRMKDLYSFHQSEEDLGRFYEVVKDAYLNIFKRLGFDREIYVALASGGDFTKEYSHEFQVKCESGEDLIFNARKAGISYNREVAPSKCEKVTFSDETEAEIKDVMGKGIIGVEELAKFLNIDVERTSKTILFETEKGTVVAAVVRGDYDVSEYKLKRLVGCKELQLATERTVKEVTGAGVGYAGPIDLPRGVKVYYDESTEGRKNFECGANKTNYHTVNANFGRDLPLPDKFYDIKIAKEGDYYPDNGEQYEVFKASEVGNIFPLNVKFSKAFNYKYTDEKGGKQPVYMGSYGIGSSRVMGVLVEKYHDEKGVLWPHEVAPFKAHLIVLGGDSAVIESGERVYKELLKNNIDVLQDDREDVSAGEKFAEADLIGCPYRLVVSKKTGGKVEIKRRDESKVEILSQEGVVKRLTQ